MGTEERVREAAVRLFAERGFHGTGIRDLAEAAGLSSATLYHYMGTKDDLLAHLMRTSLERLLARAGEAVAADAAPLDQLAALVAMHVREHAEHRLETLVVDGEIRSLSGSSRNEILRLRDDYETIWQQVIEAGDAAGTMSVQDARLARLAVLEMCSGVSRWYAPDGRLDLATLSTRYVDMALRLVGAGT